jgi:hypothetical protein
MIISSNRALIRAQAGARAELITLFKETSSTARVRLLVSARPDGTIPPSASEDVTRDIGEMVQRVFVGSDGRKAFAQDNTALSRFGDSLNRWVAWVSAEAVLTHHNWLKKNAPPDVFEWLKLPPRNVSEMVNPFLEYDPLHRWVDPNGYRLSDRVWQGSVRTRMKIDAIVSEGIRNGDTALDIAARLERFLRPDRAPLRTKRPYGTDASFDAMRLARSEVGRAFSWSTLVAARANPYVASMNYNLSPAHPKIDICDDLASGSPYPLDACPVPIESSHPHCLCYLTANVRPLAEVNAELRAMMQRGENPPYNNPADYSAFIELLLGVVLAGLARRMMNALA